MVIGPNGADWVLGHVRAEQVRVLTHCNAGALATTAWGSASGVVRELSERGALDVVYVNETRPLLQGARLTAWELDREEIPHIVQVDSAAASTIVSGAVDVAIIGADRIAANGDTANKIGSLAVALAVTTPGPRSWWPHRVRQSTSGPRRGRRSRSSHGQKTRC